MTLKLSDVARIQFNALEDHYVALGRETAVTRLERALEEAGRRFELGTTVLFEAPRPYPSLTNLGWRWLIVRPYWFAIDDTGPSPIITAIVHQAADIPARVRSSTP